MSVPARRTPGRDPREPVVHELSPVRFEGMMIRIHLSLRQGEDGLWCGRLHFLEEGKQVTRDTAEIFRGITEEDLWASVQGLGDHHFRDLYRSLGQEP